MTRQPPERHSSDRRLSDRRGARRRESAPPSPGVPVDPRAGDEELRQQLKESLDTIEAIRSGAVDAVVVHTPEGERVYALETADQPYRMMVERMQQGAATLTSDGTILFANPAFSTLVGGAPEVLVGLPFTELFQQEEVDTVRRAVERAREKSCSFTTRLGAAPGGTPVYVAASPIHMAPAEVCVIVTDLTERQRVQELEAALGHFQVLADSSPVPIWVTDAEGAMLLVNHAYCEFFGVNVENVQREGWQPLLHPDDRAAYVRAFGRALRERTPFRAETRAWRADGEWRWVVSYGAPWFSDSGEYLGCVGSSPDLTDQKRVEDALRQSEERFRLATEALRGLVYDWDIAAGRVDRSAGLLDLVGFTPEETPADPMWLWERVHPEDQERRRRRFEIAAAGRAAAFDGEYRVRHKDGRYVWVWDHSRVIYDAEGRPSRVVGCVISVDEQKRLQQALEQGDRQKDRFLATLAHELRNPLAPIRNAIAVLKALGPATPELDWGRNVVDRQVQHMARLLDDLLDVSRITQDKLQLRKERLELRRVLETALETTLPFIEESGHEIDLRLPDDPIPLDADPVRLSQVFANLLNNAAKYTDRSGRIALRVERRGATVAVSVTDTGIGISPEALPTVFDMFSQATPALERARGGLGIGLSLVRGVVELHGGRVQARSEGPGKGSEFVVELPVVSAPFAAVAPPPEPAEVVAAIPKLRVLVADDNRDTTESLALMLTMKGHDVRTAFDGEEAFQAAESFRPDVALLDVGMPKASGHTVAQRIRGASWGGRMILVAQTGWGHEDDRRKTIQAGFDHHLVKPVSPEALANLLASIDVKRETGRRAD
jgi:PAS domain S-box-containing protein